jgi:RNA polymerase sigma factor (sigma-70 family)
MEPTDQRLLSQAAAGDPDAFAVFFRRHQHVVTRFALTRARDADEVADVVSETFLAALRGAGRYEAEHPHAVPWLLGIAINVVLRRERSARRRLRLRARVAGTTPRYTGAEADAIAQAVDAARRGPALAAALATLPARERAVLELVAYADLSPGEAAVALGISSNAARLRLSRARARMRAVLGDREPSTDLEAADAR